LLVSSPIVEQKTFLKGFIKNIVVGSNDMTIKYTLPMGPTGATEEVIGVLPFIRHGEPSVMKGRTFSKSFKLPF